MVVQRLPETFLQISIKFCRLRLDQDFKYFVSKRTKGFRCKTLSYTIDTQSILCRYYRFVFCFRTLPKPNLSMA